MVSSARGTSGAKVIYREELDLAQGSVFETRMIHTECFKRQS